MSPQRDRPLPALAIALVLALAALGGGPAAGQCILANPSFEIAGSGGAAFGGWNQFNVVGPVGGARHGVVAASVVGPDLGGWDVSGVWQRLDSGPGEQWEATGYVRHPATAPLTGPCTALVNVEWRDAAGALIDYDSFAVADPASPPDRYRAFSVLSAPAPAGTAAIHFLLGVLQGPEAPAPEVHFDQVTLYSATPPTIDDLQWNDFPGGRTVAFAGRTWRVKGPGYYGPGPSLFCDEPDCVWVDAADRLHLTIRHRGAAWYSTEVALTDRLGYGDYVFTTVGALDRLDVHAVLGLFLWQYGPCWDESYLWWNPYNEFDVEFGRWGIEENDIGQFVAQPWDRPGNLDRFDATFGADEPSSHAFRWLPDRVECRSWRGGPEDEAPGTMIHEWTYAGPHVPRPDRPRVHMNLWQVGGPPAADQEVIVDAFTFVPAAGTVAVADGAGDGPPAAPAGRLGPAAPNPCNPRTTVRFELDREGYVALGVYDLQGRLVRTIVGDRLAAGRHRAEWDGRDDGNRPVASGVYLLVLAGEDFVETRRVSLVK